MAILYWIGLLVCALPFLSLLDGPKRDRRFKTGYKNNAVPQSIGCLNYLKRFLIAYVIGFGLMKIANYVEPGVDFIGLVESSKKEEIVKSIKLISNVNLRNAPNASESEIIRIGTKGEELSNPVKQNDKWFKAYDQKTKENVYVHNKYTEVIQEIIYTEENQIGNYIYFTFLAVTLLILLNLLLSKLKKKKKIELHANIQDELLHFESPSREYMDLIIDLELRIDEIVKDLQNSKNPAIKEISTGTNTGFKEILLLDYLAALSFINEKLGKKPSKDAFAFCYLFMDDKKRWKECLVSGSCKNSEWNRVKNVFTINNKMLNFLKVLSLCNYLKINKYVALINQIALVICKSDGIVSSEEEGSLKELRNITSGFANNNILSSEKVNKVRSKKNLEDLLQELNSLIGLSDVKEEVISMVNFLKIQKERNKQGLKNIDLSLHCIFKGPPGTGKTTVARILSEIYFELGYLEESKLIETDRSGLVAQYVGQTAVKTNEIVDKAMNGVLFIDEAYMLYNDSGSDFGREAIGVLLKRMEDDRKNFAVVMAGYPKEMNDLISLNPGLESRINRHIIFEEFNVQELYEIFLLICHNSEYELHASANNSVLNYIKYLHKNRTESFGNARKMRNLFEETIEKQAMRLGSKSKLNSQDLVLLTIEDIPSIDQISN